MSISIILNDINNNNDDKSYNNNDANETSFGGHVRDQGHLVLELREVEGPPVDFLGGEGDHSNNITRVLCNVMQCTRICNII